jgi:hypothetical protein
MSSPRARHQWIMPSWILGFSENSSTERQKFPRQPLIQGQGPWRILWGTKWNRNLCDPILLWVPRNLTFSEIHVLAPWNSTLAQMISRRNQPHLPICLHLLTSSCLLWIWANTQVQQQAKLTSNRLSSGWTLAMAWLSQAHLHMKGNNQWTRVGVYWGTIHQ